MPLPEYYYAKPRLEHLTPASKDFQKPISWSVIPNSLYESILALGLGAAPMWENFTSHARPRPLFTGAWKFAALYYAGLMFARWSDRAIVKENRYDDRVVKDYMQMFPQRFPDYQPKKMLDTFQPWYPNRSGGSMRISEFMAKGRKKETEHYVPLVDEKS